MAKKVFIWKYIGVFSSHFLNEGSFEKTKAKKKKKKKKKNGIFMSGPSRKNGDGGGGARESSRGTYLYRHKIMGVPLSSPAV